MAEASFSAAVVGCTGLVGSNILTTLLNLQTPIPTHTFSRRALPSSLPSPPMTPHIDASPSTWTSTLSTLKPTHPAHATLFSALGTTRAAAGSLEAQRAVDHDLNLDLARAARAAGFSTYVLVSTHGAHSGARLAYPRMKGELEDAVRGLGFRHTVILRPGLLVGPREQGRGAEAVARAVAGFVGKLGDGFKDFWAQDAEVVARAAVAAARECAEGRREEGVWILAQADIVRLGRKEWSG